MSDSIENAEGGSSLPEDIAAKAGLPHGDETDRDLHTVGQKTGPAVEQAIEAARVRAAIARDHAGATAQDAARSAQDFVEEPAEIAAREAANRASALRERAADLAGSARDHIEDTVDRARERVGETIDRTRERVGDAYDDARAWTAERYEAQARRAAALAERGRGQLRDTRSATEAFVSDNPLLVGIVGLAGGLLLGSLLPRTRQENRVIGPYADELRDQGLRYAREMTHRGRDYVQAALDPDHLDEAVRRAHHRDDEAHYEGPERTAHRL